MLNYFDTIYIKIQRGEIIMHCPMCGENIDGLEEKCRREFDKKYGRYFHNIRIIRKHQGCWRGVWAGVSINLLLLVFLFGLGGWSWDGFLQGANRMLEQSYILLLGGLVIPVICAYSGVLLALEYVDAKEEVAYEEFRATYGFNARKNRKEQL